MPVTTRKHLGKIKAELSSRYNHLSDCIIGRSLNSPKEGARKGHWIDPECMAATEGSEMEISLAVEDFKAILAEIKKLK